MLDELPANLASKIMAVITVSGADSWVVARWAFTDLMERARELLASEPDLRARIDAAEANDGLHFGRLPRDQAERMLQAVRLMPERTRIRAR